MSRSNERAQAAAIAERFLDEPYADPDGDQCVLARQFNRSQEEIGRLRTVLRDVLDQNDLSCLRASEEISVTEGCPCANCAAQRTVDGLSTKASPATLADPECQHDLLKPGTTIEVIDKWKAKCKVCIEFFDLPGRPEPSISEHRGVFFGDES